MLIVSVIIVSVIIVSVIIVVECMHAEFCALPPPLLAVLTVPREPPPVTANSTAVRLYTVGIPRSQPAVLDLVRSGTVRSHLHVNRPVYMQVPGGVCGRPWAR
jgi:hypothetical protein